MELTGYRFEDSNALITVYNSTCGDASTNASNAFWRSPSLTGRATTTGVNSATYELGSPLGSPGALYRVCWAHDPGTGGYGNLSRYLVEVQSAAEIVGPEAREFDCTLGLQCNIALSGYHIANTSAVIVLR